MSPANPRLRQKAPPFKGWGRAVGGVILLVLLAAYGLKEPSHPSPETAIRLPEVPPEVAENAVRVSPSPSPAQPEEISASPGGDDTPVGTRALFERIALAEPGAEKERLVQLADSSASPESLPVALEILSVSNDAGAIRAAQQIVARLADAATVQSLLDAYDAEPPAEMRDRLSQTLAAIVTEEAVPVLRQVVGDMETAVLDQMVRSAAHSLAAIGTPPAVDALLERISAEPSPEGRVVLAEALEAVANPAAEEVLRETATGANKLASSSEARAAAVQALANVAPQSETQTLLRRLRSDADPRVADAAALALSTQAKR